MDFMDDVLDLKDSLLETWDKETRKARRVLRGESGFSTLIVVLVILAVGAIIITPLLVFVITGQRAGETHERTTHRFYAADTGIQDGMWKVSSGDYPDEWKGTWDDAVYGADPLEYTLPDQVNGCDVTVSLRPMWLLAGLEDPGYGREPHGELVTVSNVVGGGHMQVVIVSDSPGNYKLERIGVWIPEGFTYTVGSSTLEKLPDGDPAHCDPTISEWRNGHTIIFDYSTAVDFVDFPGVTGNRMVLTFDYTPGSGMTTSWSWCRTNRHDIYLSYSGDIKLYQIESTATDPETGLSTTVIAGNMTNESVGTYLAYYGDYAVTGNAIMRDHDGDKYYRERLYDESPGEVSIIPDSATVRRILLYWSGWKEMPEDVWGGNTSTDVSTWSQEDQDALQALASNYRVNQVSLRVEYDGDSYDLGTIEASEWTVLPNGSSGSPNGWSYGCNYDITDLVEAALPADFVGNATYWVGHADTSGTASPSDETMQGIWGSSASDIFVVGDYGTILHYNGGSWSVQSSGTTRDLKCVWGSASNNVYTAGYRRTVRSYNGSAWSSSDAGGTSYPTLYGIWGSASNNVFAVGGSSLIRKYTSSWATQTRSDGRTETLRGVWGSSATDAWIVGDRYKSGTPYYYTLLHTTNGGTSWTNVGSTKTGGQNLNGIWGSSANDIFAVGAGGTILHCNNGTGGAAAWTAMTSGTTEALYGVWGTAANDVYAVGASGTILHYDGISWSAMTSDSERNLYGAWGTSSSNVYVVGESTGKASTILHWDGSTWTAVAGGTSLYTWVNGHSGETATVSTDFPLSDVVENQWANAAWSVITLYSSPETLAHQMYLFDTFRYWNSNDDVTFNLEGFLAPASIASEDDALKLTCFVGEGDSLYNGDNIYLNGIQLNTGASGNALASNNVWNGVSNSGGTVGYPPDGLDLDTFTIDGSSGIIDPADSSATARLVTGIDIWNLVYMILSFRSDVVGSGLLSYIVL